MANLAYASVPRIIELFRSIPGFAEMVVSVVDKSHLAIGRDPLKPTGIIDLSKEEVLISGEPNALATVGRTDSLGSPYTPGRASGQHWFELLGVRADCGTQKQVLIDGLRAIEGARPGTLEKLTEKKKRTKRIVAEDRRMLFDSQSLRDDIDRFSERLDQRWWVGTNNSAAETASWLRQACECAELRWGEDFTTSL